eukprot:INCI11096.1.p1 GENE.INCI11096.1~~INCI11096.1.p1  ORF type:complete len:333 (-),score=59.55 INCI11096.1:91-984(-)
MSVDIPYTKTKVLHKVSGSAFDSTAPLPKISPGRHKLNTKPIDSGAFSNSTSPGGRTKISPKNFLKKGDGNKILSPAARAQSPSGAGSPGAKKVKRKKESMAPRANPPNTTFRKFYERGDLPVQINHDHPRSIQWKIEVNQLDFHHYLPVFFDGIREKEHPYAMLAEIGSMNMLENGGKQILPVIPQLIIPLKNALNTRDPEIMTRVMHVLQKLLDADELIGQALVPYYRQLLPVMNIFRAQNKNLGDGIEYGQRRLANLGDLIQETLEMLEIKGGNDAFINIKYLIPTYQSVVMTE